MATPDKEAFMWDTVLLSKMGYTVSFLSHKIGFLCKLLNIFERIWNILL